MGGATIGISNSEVTNDSYTAGDEQQKQLLQFHLHSNLVS